MTYLVLDNRCILYILLQYDQVPIKPHTRTDERARRYTGVGPRGQGSRVPVSRATRRASRLPGAPCEVVGGVIVRGRCARCAARGARCGWAELGGEALGVAREHRRLADVGQTEEEHDHALETHAAARVREGAILEGVHVRLDGAQVDRRLLGRGARGEHLAVVDALCARSHLLAPDEDVVRVGVARVDGVGHRVKGADIGRELVDHVKVLPVLLGHHLIRVRVRVRVSSSATTR